MKGQSKSYNDPVSGTTKKFTKLHKVKVEGVWSIMVESNKKTTEYDYEEFAAANPGFKSKLSH